jgi:hypothetical protein
MTDITPDPDTTPLDDSPPPTQDPGTSPSAKGSRALEGSERSLDRRWWWQAFVFTIVGIAVIGFQLGVITAGQAIVATWIMVAIGAALIVAGPVTAWRDRPRHASDS